MSSGVRDMVRVIARITTAQLTTTRAASLGSTGGLGPDQTQPRCSSVSSVGPFPRLLRSEGRWAEAWPTWCVRSAGQRPPDNGALSLIAGTLGHECAQRDFSTQF